MRVFIASTSPDLEVYRRVARDVVLEMAHQPLLLDHGSTAAIPVQRCMSTVAKADVVLAIIGWRPTFVPGAELGGDGFRSYADWELHGAGRAGKPVLVMMTTDRWPDRPREYDPSCARVMNLRGELYRLAVFFDHEKDEEAAGFALPGFRSKVGRELALFLQGRSGTGESSVRNLPPFELRVWPPPELPDRPYPLLLPCRHPDLLGGRDRELAELSRLLEAPALIIGLYAASGAGKSSLLKAGLIPRLRAERRPVAFVAHPHEPGLPRRLLGDLVQTTGRAKDLWAGAEEPLGFVQRLLAVERVAGYRPILVLDQLEVLMHPEHQSARGVLGGLLAASAQRQPGFESPPCLWLLSYRQEFHGQLVTWLRDVLREARSEHPSWAAHLPHDLSGPDRFRSWALPPLGAAHGEAGGMSDATSAFLSAIETPLKVLTPEGRPRYPVWFSGDGARRLAAAFARARLAKPDAPLVPELQVVLADVLEQAGLAQDGILESHEPLRVGLPEDPGELIDRALEKHLQKALERAVPAGRHSDVRKSRARTMLTLRELADASGRRNRGMLSTLLAQAIGADGKDVLESLATPSTRIVMVEERPEGWVYSLSHDRMARIICQVVDEEAASLHIPIDNDLVAVRRFVALSTELFQTGERRQSTRVSSSQYRIIEAHSEALLWGEKRRGWWRACRARKRADRRGLLRWSVAGLLVLAAAGYGIWNWADSHQRRRSTLDQIRHGEPEAALEALDLALGQDLGPEALRSALRLRQRPADLLELGMAEVGAERRPDLVIDVAELLSTAAPEAGTDFAMIGALVWALDAFSTHDPLPAGRAAELRRRILQPLRESRPPPTWPEPDDPEWATLAGGSFAMGARLDEAPEDPEHAAALPIHEVSISPLRMLVHEVTNREYRRLVPDHEGGDTLPVVWVNWYEAYTYAAWMGGRLPTEAEWEYAARALCPVRYCDSVGEPATLERVGWYRGNSATAERSEAVLRPVMQLEPNRWGLYDMHGNAWEWVADWFGSYGPEPQVDPWGPATGEARLLRGGCFWFVEDWARSSSRNSWRPDYRDKDVGFRVVLPATASSPPTGGDP